MDDYEKSIREKVFNSGLLTNGEWVYLVGVFAAAKDLDDLWHERGRLRTALFAARPFVPETEARVQAKISDALGPIAR